MSDRLTGLCVVVVALAFMVGATQLEEPFFADPLGPKAFPMLVAAVAIISGIVMVLKPDADPKWPALGTLGRIGFAVVVLFAYALTLVPLGFLVPTAVASAAISYQIHSNIKSSILTGIGLSVGLFVLFRFILGLSLFAFPRWLGL